MKTRLIQKSFLIALVALVILVAGAGGSINNKGPFISVPGNPNPAFPVCSPSGLYRYPVTQSWYGFGESMEFPCQQYFFRPVIVMPPESLFLYR